MYEYYRILGSDLWWNTSIYILNYFRIYWGILPYIFGSASVYIFCLNFWYFLSYIYYTALYTGSFRREVSQLCYIFSKQWNMVIYVWFVNFVFGISLVLKKSCLCFRKNVGIFFQKHYDVFYQELIEIPFSSVLKSLALLSVTLSISAQNLSLWFISIVWQSSCRIT